MKTKLDYAKGGMEGVGELAPSAAIEQAKIEKVVNGLLAAKKARVHIEVDSADGIKEAVEAVAVPVNGQGMKMLSVLSDARPAMYLREGGTTTHGMLSPNYSANGEDKRTGVRFQGIQDESFVIRNGVWLPDPDTALILAGATGLEAKGVGGHGTANVGADLEHKMTVYGAVSIGDANLARNHGQHHYREEGGSMAAGLTNGTIGNVFAPGAVPEFSGFADPVDLNGAEGATAYFPLDYLNKLDQSFGALMTDGDISPDQVVTGAALRTVAERHEDVGYFASQMEAATC